MGRSNYAKRAKLPTISGAAVDAYLQRRLQSFDFMKEVPAAELHAEARRLGHRFASDPWHSQLVCFNIGAVHPRFLFFKKMGGGKSSLWLNLLRYRLRKQQVSQGLMMVPESIHVHSWEQQIMEHAPDVKYRLLLGNQREKERQLARGAQLYVANYGTMQTFMTEKGKKKGKDYEQMLVQSKEAAAFAQQFNFVGVDELHRVTNPDAMYMHCFRYLFAAADFGYVLDGTPFGKDPMPLFHYFRMVDGGETLGKLVGMFRQVFYTPTKDYWSGVKWTFNKDMAPELHRIIKHRSIYYAQGELADMPKKLSVRIPVRLTGEGRDYYERIIGKVKEARGDYRSVDSLYHRMRQCTSGFIAMKADDDSRIEVQFKDNPKLDALIGFLKSRPGEKLAVFHEYIITGNIIAKALREAKIPFAALNGQVEDSGAEYRRFLKDEKCQVFVLNNRMGSENLNFHKVARRVAIFESPDDPKRREQLEARVWRPGSESVAFINDIYIKGTVDEKILKSVAAGISVATAILQGTFDLTEFTAEEEGE